MTSSSDVITFNYNIYEWTLSVIIALLRRRFCLVVLILIFIRRWSYCRQTRRGIGENWIKNFSANISTIDKFSRKQKTWKNSCNNLKNPNCMFLLTASRRKEAINYSLLYFRCWWMRRNNDKFSVRRLVPATAKEILFFPIFRLAKRQKIKKNLTEFLSSRTINTTRKIFP